jgi:hypothetical protein
MHISKELIPALQEKLILQTNQYNVAGFLH